MKKDDAAVLALDVSKLAQALCHALGIEPKLIKLDGLPRTFRLGTYFAYAGCGFPVYLTIQPKRDILTTVIASVNTTREAPAALLLPTLEVIDHHLRASAHVNRLTLVGLSEHVFCIDPGRISIAPDPARIFSTARAAVVSADASAELRRAWHLPSDARWEELTLDFIEQEVIRGRFRGVTKRLEPEQLGMKNRKNGRPTLQWTLLRQMARAGGKVAWTDQGATTGIKKQKQELSDKLEAAFGIQGDPIEWDDESDAHVARFILRASGLHSEPPEDHRRTDANRPLSRGR